MSVNNLKVGEFLFGKIRYKLYQKWFCKQFVKRSKALSEYKYYLKRQSKKDWVRGDFIYVAIYDVLDNDGMNKLVKSLHRLKKKNKFEVEAYYLSRRFKKLNYINSNMAGRQTGIIGDIKFKEDKWISSISLSYTYINNSEAIIEYCFHFRKVMNTYVQIHEFVMDNIIKAKKAWYFHTYADKLIIKKANYDKLFRLDDIFFADILQAYICSLFYTQLGNEYKLPVEYSYKIYHNNYKKTKRLRKAFLQECFEKGKEHLLISNLNYDRLEVAHFYSGKHFYNPMLLSYFSNFSTEFYYKAFMNIELRELERHMRKYLNSRKKFVSSKDMKWLINKIRYIQEQEERISYVFKDENKHCIESMIGWSLFMSGQKRNKDLINYPTQTNYFKLLYKQNLEYLNSIASVQNDKIVIVVTIATLIATIASIALTLF